MIHSWCTLVLHLARLLIFPCIFVRVAVVGHDLCDKTAHNEHTATTLTRTTGQCSVLSDSQ